MNEAKKLHGNILAGYKTQADNLVEKLRELHLHLATAESCTGGLLSGAITAVPGASDIFDCGIISYSNKIKINVLHVDEEMIRAYGAVSEQTAKAMAQGVRILAHADLALATTGIAGPGGGSVNKPVGLVYSALDNGADCLVKENYFRGNRSEIRTQTVIFALKMLEDYLTSKYSY